MATDSPRPTLNFTHPWSSVLFGYEVPRNKWDEFFRKYGRYWYTGTTDPALIHENNEALVWIHTNSARSAQSYSDGR